MDVVNYSGFMWNRNRKIEQIITLRHTRFTWFGVRPMSMDDIDEKVLLRKLRD